MGYYNSTNVSKFEKALSEQIARIKSGEALSVSISNANSKMGAVSSVSLLPFVTCPNCCKCSCGESCYAAKIAAMRPSVLAAYARNTALALYRPRVYWAQVDAAVKGVRFFRFHVSGDIMGKAYFRHMVETAENNPHCEMLCFTKQFQIVNEWIDSGKKIPENLHILFSGWSNLEPENRHNLPETNVIPRGGEPKEEWKICGGNCFNCACRGVGCWQAQKGETIAFPIH